MNQEWNLTGGVIIIGSLLWEDHLCQKKKDNIRKKWRRYYLDQKSKIIVKIPIRYGRYSKKGIYTMVFSNESQSNNQLGTGYVIPFRYNPINNFNQLLKKVKAMSKAEGMNQNFWGGNVEIWGNMGILFNNSKIDKKIRKKILINWEKQFFNENIKLHYGNFKFKDDESPCITNKGELTINWIEPIVKRHFKTVSNFDFLIASATVPKHANTSIKDYPNPQEIADSVNNDTYRYYFLNNIRDGITTFQDNEILNKL